MHYRFIDASTFETMRERGELLEWAKVHGNYYGTPRGAGRAGARRRSGHPVRHRLAGHQQIYDKLRPDIVCVFVLPPSSAELKRGSSAGPRTAEIIARRLQKPASRSAHWTEYDYVLVNDDLDAASNRLKLILADERGKRARKAALAGLVEELKADLDVLARG